MDDETSGTDYISDLPQCIIETILTLLPLRDAVRTSILSSEWRYKWSTLTKLVFDEDCVADKNDDPAIVAKSLVKFVNGVLFLHQGEILKFHFSTLFLDICPDAEIDQWLLFLSRKDVQEVVLELEGLEQYRMPYCFFNFKKLTRAVLIGCWVDPPLGFKGFSCLKILVLFRVWASTEATEKLVSCCPLLETLTLALVGAFGFTVRAPNLTHLSIKGFLKEVCVENAPRLVSLTVDVYSTDAIAECLSRSSSCLYTKIFGRVPCLEKFYGHSFLTKYLSVGKFPGGSPITHKNLKVIVLEVNFKETKEILVLLHLMINSPNLEELNISCCPNPPVVRYAMIVRYAKPSDMEFWDEDSLPECVFSQLKVVKIKEASCLPHERAFIKFLLAKSPMLEKIYIYPPRNTVDARLNWIISELFKSRPAFSRAKILFVEA